MLVMVVDVRTRQILRVPILRRETIPDDDNSSGFDRDHMYKTFMVYAQTHGIMNPEQFADEKLAILDGDNLEDVNTTSDYDPNGPYL